MNARCEFVRKAGVDSPVSLDQWLPCKDIADEHDAKMGLRALTAPVPRAFVLDVEMRGRKFALKVLPDAFLCVHRGMVHLACRHAVARCHIFRDITHSVTDFADH